jgi:hypothetical protein
MTGSLKQAFKAGLIGGLTGAAFSAISYGFSQQAWFDSGHELFDHNSNVVLSPSQRVGKVMSSGIVSGAGSELSGGNFKDGLKNGLGLFALGEMSQYMRYRTIMSSMRNPYNAQGLSAGYFDDGFKTGGGRYDPALGNNQVPSPLGGIQGRAGQVFGMPYGPGSFADFVVEAYGGPHDFLNSPYWYDSLGNIKNIPAGLPTYFGDAINYLNVPLATPFAVSGVLQVYLPSFSYNHYIR